MTKRPGMEHIPLLETDNSEDAMEYRSNKHASRRGGGDRGGAKEGECSLLFSVCMTVLLSWCGLVLMFFCNTLTFYFVS